MEDTSANVEYTVEKIVDHARFDDMYFRKMMFLKSRHPATDQIMGNFVPNFEKGDLCNKFVYRTRWAGYRPEDDTWEPESNFTINDKGKASTNECLVEYQKLHNIRSNQTLKAKFAGQANLETLEKFGLPAKVYTELNNRFEEWVQEVSKIGTFNEPDLNANAVFMTQPPSQLGEDKNAEKVDNLRMDFDEPETSAAGRLRELPAKEAKAFSLKGASGEISTDSLASSTDQRKAGKQSKKAKKVKLLTNDESDGTATQPSFYWERPAHERYHEIKARQTKENESTWRQLCALTDSSSSDEELPRKRSLENKLQKLKAGLASSNSNGKGGDGKSADGTIYVGTHPATRPNERKESQKKVDRAYKNENGEDIGLMGEIETGPSIGVQQKKDGPTSSGIPTSYPPPQKKPIKPKFHIDPLEKILTGMEAEKNQSEPKIQNRNSSSCKLPQNWSQRRKTILLDALPQVQGSKLKKQSPPHVPKKEKVMAEKPKAVPAGLLKENDTLIVKEKPSVKKNVIKKEAQAVHGYFQFLMSPFLAMPYKRRRARSCAGAMTDAGASFEKEIDEEAAKEHRWNELMERGVRNERPFEVVQGKVGRSIRMTQILRDGVVRYACAEKGDRRHLRRIGHVISQPVPLREIDMELVEKNEAERKKERLPRHKPDSLVS